MEIGFMLMLVGMVTVFSILLIVIYGSRLLIMALNRITKEDTAADAKSGGIQAGTRAVLEAAVRQITAGKGKIINITELK